MNKKQLWDSILQQAISGKLVPQLDTEQAVEQIGPAPAPDDVPFALPETWKLVNLKALSTHIQYGYTASASDLGEAKLLRITDIQNGKVNWDSVPFCSISASDISKFSVIPDDIVIARSGTVGKSFKVGQVKQHAVFASYLIRVRLNNKLPVNASYINFYLDSPLYWLSISQSAQGTAIKNVNAQQLSALLIPLPPLEEQRRIVAKLEELKPLVDQFGEAHDKLSELEADFPRKLKASILQAAMQGKLVPQQDTEPAVEQLGPAPSPDEMPFALPEKWKWVRMEDIVTVQPKVTCNYNDQLVSFIPMDKVSQGFNNDIDLSLAKPWSDVKNNYSRFADGDVIFAKITPCFQNRKSAIVDNTVNGIGCGSTEFITLRCSNFIFNKYLLWFVKCPYFINLGQSKFKGTAGQQRFAPKDVKNCFVPLPPLEEQRRIVERVEQLFTEVDKMSACKAP